MDTNKKKLNRFISGKFSFNDYLLVSSHFNKEEYNAELQMYMEDEWNKTRDTNHNQEQLTRMLDQLHHRINLGRSVSGSARQLYYRLFSKIAVVLIIPALITIAVMGYLSLNKMSGMDSWAEIHSPVGTRTKFQLPDGTIGWLNSGSSVKYPVNFTTNRHVEISGEAWFDVVHLESKVFHVVTPYFDVSVLGTQFNVVAYENEELAEVILEKGKVRVSGKHDEFKSELTPDEHLIFNKSTKEMVKTRIDAKSYTCWKDGLMIFKNEPMSEIARRLERRYHTEIILHGDSLQSSLFRATFMDENLEEICKMLSTVAPISYRIHERKKNEDNSFTERKIEMWLKN
ncbi:FecR family protein [Gaoshiqia sp. Z1-71]|uniref:FecR family protein n=1 Tax=Gaoshiqia hydrogeniformans TaxID=3290090 RepID=UPI003BF91AB5